MVIHRRMEHVTSITRITVVTASTREWTFPLANTTKGSSSFDISVSYPAGTSMPYFRSTAGMAVYNNGIEVDHSHNPLNQSSFTSPMLSNETSQLLNTSFLRGRNDSIITSVSPFNQNGNPKDDFRMKRNNNGIRNNLLLSRDENHPETDIVVENRMPYDRQQQDPFSSVLSSSNDRAHTQTDFTSSLFFENQANQLPQKQKQDQYQQQEGQHSEHLYNMHHNILQRSSNHHPCTMMMKALGGNSCPTNSTMHSSSCAPCAYLETRWDVDHDCLATKNSCFIDRRHLLNGQKSRNGAITEISRIIISHPSAQTPKPRTIYPTMFLVEDSQVGTEYTPTTAHYKNCTSRNIHLSPNGHG
jgi:hypothetical protein